MRPLPCSPKLAIDFVMGLQLRISAKGYLAFILQDASSRSAVGKEV